jgi:hypothetical protein
MAGLHYGGPEHPVAAWQNVLGKTDRQSSAERHGRTAAAGGCRFPRAAVRGEQTRPTRAWAGVTAWPKETRHGHSTATSLDAASAL